MSLDIAPAIRTAMVEDVILGGLLPQWQGELNVHTRRPVPSEAPYPMAIINPAAAIGDEDGLTSVRPLVVRDIAVYGRLGDPRSDDLRVVDRAAYRIRDLFHRQKFSVLPDGFSVIDVVAAGPVPAPVDDEKTVGRLVTLTIRLWRQT